MQLCSRGLDSTLSGIFIGVARITKLAIKAREKRVRVIQDRLWFNF